MPSPTLTSRTEASQPELHPQAPGLADTAARPSGGESVGRGSTAPPVGLSSIATAHEPTTRRHASAAPSAASSALPAQLANGGAASSADISSGAAGAPAASTVSAAPSAEPSGTPGLAPHSGSSGTGTDVHLSQGPKPEP